MFSPVLLTPHRCPHSLSLGLTLTSTSEVLWRLTELRNSLLVWKWQAKRTSFTKPTWTFNRVRTLLCSVKLAVYLVPVRSKKRSWTSGRTFHTTEIANCWTCVLWWCHCKYQQPVWLHWRLESRSTLSRREELEIACSYFLVHSWTSHHMGIKLARSIGSLRPNESSICLLSSPCYLCCQSRACILVFTKGWD